MRPPALDLDTYGRKIGKRRLAPHPKSITIRVTPIGGGTAWKTEITTPRMTGLSDNGITEEEAWRVTLEVLAARVKEEFSQR